MELNYLREFVVLAQICRFQDAADVLCISQSSLSKHIKSIETEFDMPLFKRSTRKVELTHFGQEFLPYAARIAEIQRDYSANLLAKLKPNSKVLSIGISPAVAPHNLMPLIPSFSKSDPDYRLSLIEQENVPLINLLTHGECDMIIVNENADVSAEAVNRIPFFEDSLVAVLPSTHPLVGKEGIPIDALSGEQYIQLGPQSTFNPVLGTPVITVGRVELAMDLIQKGAGISILPRNAAIYYQRTGVALVTMDFSPVIRFNLMYPKERKINHAMQTVIDFVKSHGH